MLPTLTVTFPQGQSHLLHLVSFLIFPLPSFSPSHHHQTEWALCAKPFRRPGDPKSQPAGDPAGIQGKAPVASRGPPVNFVMVARGKDSRTNHVPPRKWCGRALGQELGPERLSTVSTKTGGPHSGKKERMHRGPRPKALAWRSTLILEKAHS